MQEFSYQLSQQTTLKLIFELQESRVIKTKKFLGPCPSGLLSHRLLSHSEIFGLWKGDVDTRQFHFVEVRHVWAVQRGFYTITMLKSLQS